MLPHDFPPWGLVSYYFYTWLDAGLIDRIHAIMRVDLRRLDDREPTPGAAVHRRRSFADEPKGAKESSHRGQPGN